MKSEFDDVGDFHEKFGLDNVTHHGARLREVPPELMEFRIKFLHEELQEFEDAVAAGDVLKAFDALLDLAYVTYGTAHFMGLPWHDGWRVVHTANMSKVRAASDGSDSMRASAWDVVKPPGWRPPDLSTVVNVEEAERCSQCHRDLAQLDLKEVVTLAPYRHVIVYCVCGHEVARRPV